MVGRGKLHSGCKQLTSLMFDYREMCHAPKLATMCISFSRTASDYVGHVSPYRESIQSLGYCTEMAKWNQQNAKSFSSVINYGRVNR
jgi:hypothetical protein